jgi:glyoxylase-like metal-dependent hydrolase (beta-lactamase superfamily II)
MTSRRGFIRRVLGPAWVGGALLEQSIFRAVHARAQSNPGLPELFEVKKIAEGVFMAVAKPQTLINSNAVIFENARDLLIMDSHSKPSAVVALVSQLRRRVTEKPVKYIVSSHFHWDHSQGLPAYRRMAPHAEIISTETTRKLISEQTVPRLKASFEQLKISADDYKKKAAAATSSQEKAAWEKMRRETGDYLREMQTFTPELPNLTLTADLTIHDRNHDLHLAFRGRGHTAGDVVAFCPQKKVIATGDLLHGFFPFIGDGFPLDWPRTLLQVAEFDFTQIAGGHGDLSPRQRVYQMGNYIEEVTERVAQGKRAGKSQQQMEAEITPASLKTLADGGFGDASARAILDLRMLPPTNPTPASVLTDAVRTNVGHIFTALDRS